MNENGYRRRRVYVDFEVQGRLCVRVALYWVGLSLLLLLTMSCAVALEGGAPSFPSAVGQAWTRFGSALTLALCALPLAMLDFLIVTNKFCGPTMRLKRSMKQLADEGACRPLKIRQGDLLDDMVDDFNRVAERLERAERQLAQRQVPVAPSVAADRRETVAVAEGDD